MSLNERNSIEWLQTDAGRALAWKLAFFVPLLICLVSVWSPVPPTSVWWTASGLLLLALMATISVTDLLWCRIPNWATYSAFAWGLAINAYASTAGDESLRQSLGAVGLQQSLLGALIPFGVMLVIFSLTGGGAGDVKLTAAMGSLLGLSRAIDAILISLVVAGVFALGRAVWQQGPRQLLETLGRAVGSRLLPMWIAPPTVEQRSYLRQAMPLGPSFAVGTVLVLWGVQVASALSAVGLK